MSSACSLSPTDDELRSFWSYLSWMCVDQFDARHAMVSWSLFLLLSVYIPIASHFIFSCAPTHRVYDVVIQLSLTSTSDLSYLCLFVFVRRYNLCHSLFLNKMNYFLT
ncbi:hypothetical protein GW17_00025860 [Ensete ventricosum]|uniref:Uncharacterized protein n=1 Tax=Ensete ventricosum TaxID=4639 RepID=A0A444EJL3_ENSVE|nr:hypothetical protein GW17_00025860 [Ensete ventricosum]RZR72589.1 hypothetical protein BHM03_00014780 [Ensete ventricosum]